jgi:hypothetical protein
LAAPETINDRGEIAGNGVDSNGNQHAFLLIPCSADDTACQDAAAGPSIESVRPTPAAQRPTETNQGNPVHPLLRLRLGPRYYPVEATTSPQSAALVLHTGCLVSGGVLTGNCLFICSPFGTCCQRYEPAQCPRGKKAINPQRSHCRRYFLVDVSTSCHP